MIDTADMQTELTRLGAEFIAGVQRLYIAQWEQALEIVVGKELFERFHRHVPRACHLDAKDERRAAIHTALITGVITEAELDRITNALEKIMAFIPEFKGPPAFSLKAAKEVEKRRAKNRAARQQRKVRR